MRRCRDETGRRDKHHAETVRQLQGTTNVSLHVCVVCQTGGTVRVEVPLHRGLACSTGGTHRAFPGHGSGFCLVNHLAVAAKRLMMSLPTTKGSNCGFRRASGGIMVACSLYQYQPFFVVVFNFICVRQGDGTAFTFKEEQYVFILSVHHPPPSHKQQSDLDLSMEDRIEDKAYLSTGYFM